MLNQSMQCCIKCESVILYGSGGDDGGGDCGGGVAAIENEIGR